MKLYRILLLTLCAYALISCGGAEERKSVYLEKAKSSIEAGDLDKARIELKNVLQIDPKDAEAYYQLGNVYEKQQDYRKAYGSYLKAEELKPDLLENQAKLGRFYLLLMNDSEKAQEKIDFILSKEPDNSEGLLLTAAVMLRKNNVDEAINITKGVVAQDPSHIESATFLASLYIKDKKITDAINVLDAALKNNSNNEKLNKLLASVLVANKDYDRAEIIYRNFLERNPDSRSSYNNLAAFYKQTGNEAKAEEILRLSVDNDPDNEDRILTLIKYIRGEKGNDAAIKELESFIATNNRLGKLRIALAELFILNSDKESAIKIFKETITDFSEEVTGVTARTVLASIYISNADYEKAAEIIEEAISISPNDPQVNYLRAKFAVRDKDLEKAIISLRIVTKETPENIEAFILLANVYLQEGNEEQFKSTLNSAYDNNKTNTEGLLKLAQFQMSRDIIQAEKIIDDYNSIKGSDYDGLSIKALILNKNKSYAEAFKIAENLMEAYPDKPNGYLQTIPFYSQKMDKISAISVLERGYLSTTDNKKILLLLTTLQVSEKKFDVAEKRLVAELKASPDDLGLQILLAKVYIAKDDSASAVSLLNKVINAKPEHEEAYLILAQHYLIKKESDAAITTLADGTVNAKTSIKIPLKLATLYEQEESYKKAIDVYRDTYVSFPDNLIVINNLASLLSDYSDDKEDLKTAKMLADKLVDTEQSVFLDTTGWVYYKLGDYQTAIQHLSKSVEKSPQVYIFNYHLGMAYKMAGDKVNAKRYLEKSLSGDKPFKEQEKAEAALKDI